MLLLFVAIIFLSCEDSQTNSPALQANLNATFFKAYSTSAIVNNNDQMIEIIGTSDHEEFTLHTEWMGATKYAIAYDSSNYATFTTANGTVYTTRSPGSSGSITITKEDKESQEFTGNFDFTFITPTDTIAVSKGIFYGVRYRIVDVVPN